MSEMNTGIGSDLDFSSFKRKVKMDHGLDLEAYKRPQMERRIRANMTKCGAHTFTQYYSMLQKDRVLLEEFLDRVTINVSELFRNPDQFDVLQKTVIPELLARFGKLRVWSAGCSCGAEAYTLAIILDELAPNSGSTVIGTDIDERMLARATLGNYQSHEIKSVTESRLRKYFEKQPDGSYTVNSSLKRKISFRKQDLLRDRYDHGFNLVLCRNVVIYFTDEAKSTLYKGIFGSLEPGGYLFVGGTERITDYNQIGFENRIPFFYLKPEKH